jgi:hypothetical protein
MGLALLGNISTLLITFAVLGVPKYRARRAIAKALAKEAALRVWAEAHGWTVFDGGAPEADRERVLATQAAIAATLDFGVILRRRTDRGVFLLLLVWPEAQNHGPTAIGILEEEGHRALAVRPGPLTPEIAEELAAILARKRRQRPDRSPVR